MGLESVTYVGDLNTANPTGTDPKNQGDDHIRNLKTALRNSFAGFAGAIVVTGTDGGAVNAYTLTPTTAITAYGTRMIALFAPTITSTGAVTLNISDLGAKSVKAVDGAALVAGDLVSGSVYAAVYTGTEFRLLSITKNYADQLALATALPAQSLGFVRSDGTTAGFTTTHTGYAQNEVKGADIASAATINLTAPTGNLVHVTGTTTITAITIPVGAERTIIFDGALTLTHGAALLLPGAANIITAANDRMTVRGDTAGAIVVSYDRANGAPVANFPYLKVSDQKASGTDGGGSAAADFTQVRTLNTTDANTVSGASLSANGITLPEGTYRVRLRAPHYFAGGGSKHKVALYNSTDGSYTLIGSTAYCQTAQSDSVVSGQFTITASKLFYVRHYTQAAQATTGLGISSSSGQVEIYTEAEFWKVA